MAKKKKQKKMASPVIDKKMLKEQEKLCKKWQAGKDVHLARIGLLGTMKTTLRAINRYKNKGLDQLLSPGMGYSQKKYQKELKKESKLIEDIKKESSALLKALEEII